MNKFLIVFCTLFICLLCYSCDGEDQNKDTYFHNTRYVLVDELSNFSDNYYAISDKFITNEEFSCNIFSREDDKHLENIYLPTTKASIAIYDNTIYIIYKYNNKIMYSYKVIGSNKTLDDNLCSMNEEQFNGFLEINNQFFFSKDIYSLKKIDYNIEQGYRHNIGCTIYDKPKAYNIKISENNDYLYMSSYDGHEIYSYKISSEVLESKYNYKTNFAFMNWPKWNEKDNLIFVGKYITFLNDNCLYFSYSKYLGEFDNANHYCYNNSGCLFGRYKTEILRFNCTNNQIESVGILPDGFSVLKLYLDGALIMKNNVIAYYSYSTKNYDIIQNIDWTNYYQLSSDDDDIKIYLKNKSIEKIDIYSGANLVCDNFECRG